jgi:hypothetical protein
MLVEFTEHKTQAIVTLETGKRYHVVFLPLASQSIGLENRVAALYAIFVRKGKDVHRYISPYTCKGDGQRAMLAAISAKETQDGYYGTHHQR